jgi:hypothetical protein
LLLRTQSDWQRRSSTATSRMSLPQRADSNKRRTNESALVLRTYEEHIRNQITCQANDGARSILPPARCPQRRQLIISSPRSPGMKWFTKQTCIGGREAPAIIPAALGGPFGANWYARGIGGGGRARHQYDINGLTVETGQRSGSLVSDRTRPGCSAPLGSGPRASHACGGAQARLECDSDAGVLLWPWPIRKAKGYRRNSRDWFRQVQPAGLRREPAAALLS